MATNSDSNDESERLYNGLESDTQPMSSESEEKLSEFLSEPLPERKKWFLSKVYQRLGGIDPEDIDTAAEILAVRSGSLVTSDEVQLKLMQAVIVEQRDAALDRMNSRFFVIMNEGGKCLVGRWNDGDVGSAITWQAPREFMLAYMGQKVFAGRNANGRVYKQLGKFWLESDRRREFDEVGFNPREDSTYEEGGSRKLNLWRGWGISFSGHTTPEGNNLETAMLHTPLPRGSDMREREKTMNEGKGEALRMLRSGLITPQQMKEFVEEANRLDAIGPLIDAIGAGDSVAVNAEQVDAYNSLQVFYAHRFVVDPSGKFDIMDEMIAEREEADKREKEGTA